MIILISKDQLLDDYKKISKIERTNYIFNATDSPKVRDLGNVLTDYDCRSSTISAISESAFQVPVACYDASLPERTVKKKIDAFFDDPSFAQNVIRLVSEQILKPNANYLITLTNNDYETFNKRYLETFAEIMGLDNPNDFVFLYDDTRGMYDYVRNQLIKKLNKIDQELDEDDDNDDLLDLRDDMIDALNTLDMADDPDISDKKARKIVRKVFLNTAVIKKKVLKKITSRIKEYEKTERTSSNPYASGRAIDDDDD